jgi:hypothetical protein
LKLSREFSWGHLASSFPVSLAKADFENVLPHDTSLATLAANLSVRFFVS